MKQKHSQWAQPATPTWSGNVLDRQNTSPPFPHQQARSTGSPSSEKSGIPPQWPAFVQGINGPRKFLMGYGIVTHSSRNCFLGMFCLLTRQRAASWWSLWPCLCSEWPLQGTSRQMDHPPCSPVGLQSHKHHHK